MRILHFAFSSEPHSNPAGHLGAVFRTVLETMRTVCVWIVDLGLFYIPLGLGQLGEAWTRYSLVQAAGFVVLVAGTLVYGKGDEEGAHQELQTAVAEALEGGGLPAAAPVSPGSNAYFVLRCGLQLHFFRLQRLLPVRRRLFIVIEALQYSCIFAARHAALRCSSVICAACHAALHLACCLTPRLPLFLLTYTARLHAAGCVGESADLRWRAGGSSAHHNA